MRLAPGLVFLAGIVIGCTVPAINDSNLNREAAAVSSADVADVNSGTYAWKVRVQWHQALLDDTAQVDEWVFVRAENHVQAQFKAVDYSKFQHGYRDSQGGIWSMGNVVQLIE